MGWADLLSVDPMRLNLLDWMAWVALATGFWLGLANETSADRPSCQQPPLFAPQPRAWGPLPMAVHPRALPYPLRFPSSAHTSVNSPFATLFPMNPLIECATLPAGP